MKAVRFHGKGDLRFEDIPEPKTEPGKVKLKPAWVGICGTDLHEYIGGANICPTTPHPITGDTIPLVMGHEFSGTIEEVGEDVTNWKVGDRVCVQPIIYDGTCGACLDGLPNCCFNNGFVGLSGRGGGMSEHVVVPEYTLFKLPPNISLKVGSLIEPLAVGWHAVNASSFKQGDHALVLGGGPIGLSVIQALKARGADKIIVSEISSRRRQFAIDFGAHYVFDPTKDDIISKCRELCPGGGVNVAYDAAGVQQGLYQAVHATRARGTIVNIAIWEKPCAINPNDLVFKERTYLGVATYVAGDFEEVLSAISSGRMEPEPMITKTIKLNEVEKEGFQTLIRNKDNQVKVLIEVGGGDF